MGLLFKYFAAASDADAAAAVGYPDPGRFDVEDLPGIWPSLTLPVVEAALTGRPLEEVADGPRCDAPIAGTDGTTVSTVSDELQRALAAAGPEQLEAAARAVIASEEEEEPWADDPEESLVMLTELLGYLAGLSRRALAGGQRVYAWVSL